MVNVRRRLLANRENEMGAFAVLPRELILCVLSALSASADKPADLFNAMLVEFSNLMLNPLVLRVASKASVSVLPRRWRGAAERFLRLCGDQGNAEANYFLGMILFYCHGRESQGWSRMMTAVRNGHAHAAFSLAVIYNNGSSFIGFGHRNPRIAAHLFALAACRGHLGALRDLAFCVTNGLGVRQDRAAGRRLTFTANMRELRARYPTGPEMAAAYANYRNNSECLTNELGCFATVPASLQGWAHPANRFLCEWFAVHPLPCCPPTRGLPLMCSFPTCGRPETCGLEYRRCHVCGIARYCSRTCQSLHWRTGHRRECVPVHQWLMEVTANANQAAVNNVDTNADLGDGGAPAPPPM